MRALVRPPRSGFEIGVVAVAICSSQSRHVAEKKTGSDFALAFRRIDNEASLNKALALKVGGSEDRQDRQV